MKQKALLVIAAILPLMTLEAAAFAEPRGMYRFEDFGCQFGDFTLLKAKGIYHLYYTRGFAGSGQTWESPGNAIDFGHAMSRDLKNWDIAAPILPVRPGCWEERSVRSPTGFKFNNLFYLFYTGIDMAAAARIGLATSEDLLIWDRTDANPVWKPSETHPGRSRAGDPCVLTDGDTHYLYYSAIETASSNNKQNVIAVAESRDLIHWQDHDAVITSATPFRSPTVFKHEDVYYLITCGTQNIAFRSSNPLTGWEQFAMDFPAGLIHLEVFQDGEAWFIAGVEKRAKGDILWISPLRWEGSRPIISR